MTLTFYLKLLRSLESQNIRSRRIDGLRYFVNTPRVTAQESLLKSWAGNLTTRIAKHQS